MAITVNGRSIEEAVEIMEADFEDDFGQACEEYGLISYEDRWGYDGQDPDGEQAMERYYDAQACRREWNTPPQYR